MNGSLGTLIQDLIREIEILNERERRQRELLKEGLEIFNPSARAKWEEEIWKEKVRAVLEEGEGE